MHIASVVTGGWLASVFFCLSIVQKSSSRDQDEVKSSRRSALLWHVSYLTYTVLLLFLGWWWLVSTAATYITTTFNRSLIITLPLNVHHLSCHTFKANSSLSDSAFLSPTNNNRGMFFPPSRRRFQVLTGTPHSLVALATTKEQDWWML